MRKFTVTVRRDMRPDEHVRTRLDRVIWIDNVGLAVAASIVVTNSRVFLMERRLVGTPKSSVVPLTSIVSAQMTPGTQPIVTAALIDGTDFRIQAHDWREVDALRLALTYTAP